MVRTNGSNGEGIESKATLSITGGVVMVYAYDDGINSAGNMNIAGGQIVSVGRNNDGIDANGNMYISGGNMVACGASGAETGIDIGEQRRLYVTGGCFLGIGGRVDATLGSTSQGIACYSGSFSANSTVTITDISGSNAYASFIMPPVSTSGSVMVSCPSMVSGSSYKVGSTTVTAASSLSSSNTGGGPGRGRFIQAQ